MIRFRSRARSRTHCARIAQRGDLLEHRLDVRRRAAVQRAGERADRRRERGAAVGARRGDDPRGEGRRVEAVLGGADPVRVDRLHVAGIGLATPAEEELLRRRQALRDDLVGNDVGLAVGDARGARDDRHHLRGDPAEILARLLVRDLVELAELPLAREARRLGLEIGRPVAREARRARTAPARASSTRGRRRRAAPRRSRTGSDRRAPRCRRRDSAARRLRDRAPRSRSRRRRRPRDQA